VHVVIGRIAVGDVLERKPPDEADDVRIGGLEDPIDLAVHVSKLLDKRLDHNLRGIEHDRLREAGAASVPIPKFAPCCGGPVCELRNRKDTSKNYCFSCGFGSEVRMTNSRAAMM